MLKSTDLNSTLNSNMFVSQNTCLRQNTGRLAGYDQVYQGDRASGGDY